MPTYLPRELLRRADSRDVLNHVLAGDTVPPQELWKLTDEHLQRLWDDTDPNVDLTELLAPTHL